MEKIYEQLIENKRNNFSQHFSVCLSDLWNIRRYVN